MNDITLENYCDKFRKMMALTHQMTFVKVGFGSGIGTTNHTVEWSSTACDFDDRCQPTLGALWGMMYGCIENANDPVHSGASGTSTDYSLIGMMDKYDWTFVPGVPCPIPGNTLPDSYTAQGIERAHNKATLRTTLPSQRGRGHVFIAMALWPQAAEQGDRHPSPFLPDGEYQRYGSCDAPAEWARRLADTESEFTLDRTQSPASPAYPGPRHGWKVTGPFVTLFEPQFESRPDLAASARKSGCTTCELGKVDITGPGVNVAIGLGATDAGDGGYLLIRGDTVAGSGDELIKRNEFGVLSAGHGAHELASRDSLNLQTGSWFSLGAGHRYPATGTLAQLRTPGGLLEVISTTPETNETGQYALKVWAGAYTQGGSGWVENGTVTHLKTIRIGHSIELMDDPGSSDPDDYKVVARFTVKEIAPSGTTLRQSEWTETVLLTDWTKLADDTSNGQVLASPPQYLQIKRGFLPNDTAWVRSRSTVFDGGFDPAGTARHRQTLALGFDTTLGARTETLTVRDQGGGSASERTLWYKKFTWGEELVQAVNDPAGEALKTTWEYYDDTASVGQRRKVKHTVAPTGFWKHYDYDSVGRVIKEVSQFKDRAYTGATSEANNRMVEYRYWSQDLSADAGNNPEFFVETIEFVEGHEVARSYTIYWVHGDTGQPGGGWDSGTYEETTDLRCRVLGAVPNFDSILTNPIGNGTALVTHHKRDMQTGRPAETLEPDGTVTLYDHNPGPLDTYGFANEMGDVRITYRGPIDASSPACPVENSQTPRAGSRQMTVRSALGAALVNASWDFQDPPTAFHHGLGPSYEPNMIRLSIDTAAQRDLLGRPTQSTHIDGLSTYTSYGCCGVETTTDRQGLTTQNFYDSLGRVEMVMHAVGITGVQTATKYMFDAEGRVLTTKRVGSDNSEITQSTNVYDGAGELTSSTDALGATTTYTEVIDLLNGRVTRTTTMPDPDGAGPLSAPTSIEIAYPDGNAVETGGTANAPVKYDYGAEAASGFGTGAYVAFTKRINVGDGGAETEWVKEYRDPVGNAYRIVYADAAESVAVYDAKNELVQQTDPDGRITRFRRGYGYDASLPGTADDWKGDWQLTAAEMDGNSQLDFNGLDRITLSRRWVSNETGAPFNGKDLVRQRTDVWTTNNSATARATVSESDVTTNGLESWSFAGGIPGTGLVSHSVTTISATAHTVTVVATNPDGTRSESLTTNGRQDRVAVFMSGGSVPHTRTKYAYDPHGRVQSITDERDTTSTSDDRTTIFAYNNADQQYQSTSPDPDGSGSQSAQITTHTFDALGRITQTQLPDSSLVKHEYFPTGAVKKTWGSHTFPVEFTYDAQGRVKTLKTWQDFNESTGSGNAGSATTTWSYSATRGWMTGKIYQGQTSGPVYDYWPSSRLKQRTWTAPRNITTNYTYTAAGDLLGVNYSDATPDVSYVYDRRGRVTQVTDAVGTRTFTLNEFGRMTEEDFGTGILDPVNITNHYDSLVRRDWIKMKIAGTLKHEVDFGYETDSSRLRSVRKDDYSGVQFIGEYSYVPHAGTIQSLAIKKDPGGGPAALITGVREYDNLDRLKSITWTPQGTSTPELKYAYAYNDANQRTAMTLADSSHWDYAYDAMGQVTSAKKAWVNPNPPPPSVPVAGQQFEFTYDDIGNRLTASAGGDSSGANLRQVTYSPNVLNQYTQRGVSSGVDIMGYASATDTVTVNGNSAYRFAGYFQQLLSWANTAAAQYQTVSILLNGNAWQTGTVFIPKTPEQFAYDADGNLLSDGRWEYTWDGENRLIAMQTIAGLPSTLPIRRLEFKYDYMSRRVRKEVYQPTAVPAADDGGKDGASGGITGDNDDDGPGGGVAPYGWTSTGVTRFIWDGWNLLGEISGTDQVIRTYTWGLDLSGSEQGAGGIGGLLFQQDGLGNVYHTLCDGNGNLMRLRDGAGSMWADYEYGAFGEILIARGTGVLNNPVRFSTKYADAETGLLYYGYRYYNAGTGRWLSRDPLEEAGGLNVFLLVSNGVPNDVDALGLDDYKKGTLDPKIVHDPGAGQWDSEIPTGGALAQYNTLKNWVQTTARAPKKSLGLGWTDAADHLKHYLDNTGDTYTIKLQNMIDEVPSARRWYEKELALAMKFTESLPAGVHDITSGKTTKGAYNTQSENSNWFFAVGGYAAWGKGKASVLCPKGADAQYTLEFHYKFADRYNWDTGKSVKIGSVTITDAFMGRLHRMGVAREFDMTGEVVETVTWTKGKPPIRSKAAAPTSGGRGR